MQQEVAVLMTQALVAKHCGHNNVIYEPKVMAFYVALQAVSPKASQVLRANLPSPHIRTLQRKNKLYESSVPFIATTREQVILNLDARLFELAKIGVINPVFSLAIDGTAAEGVPEWFSKYSAILGYASPNEMLPVPDGANKEAIDAILMPEKAELASRRLAAEVKAVVICVQDIPTGTCAFFPLCGRPQTKNEASNFNQNIMNWLYDHSLGSGTSMRYTLLNAAVDGVSCDKDFVQDAIVRFLQGSQQWLAITDPNHNMKSYRHKAHPDATGSTKLTEVQKRHMHSLWTHP